MLAWPDRREYELANDPSLQKDAKRSREVEQVKLLQSCQIVPMIFTHAVIIKTQAVIDHCRRRAEEQLSLLRAADKLSALHGYFCAAHNLLLSHAAHRKPRHHGPRVSLISLKFGGCSKTAQDEA
jgi:hypothetical protein